MATVKELIVSSGIIAEQLHICMGCWQKMTEPGVLGKFGLYGHKKCLARVEKILQDKEKDDIVEVVV